MHPQQLKHIVVFFILLILIPTIAFEAASPSSEALVVEIKPPWDGIDPGVAECVIDALGKAETSASVMIILVDSYGGWLDSALNIGDAIYSSKVPVVGFVSGKALSAGTLILLPTHVLAVSSNSIMGAMQPVSYDPLTGSVRYLNESKVLNPIIEKAVLYAGSRGRNVSSVKEFITSNLVLNAQETLRLGLSDLIVDSIVDLISNINGREVTVASNTSYVINVRGYRYHTCSLRSRTLSLLSNTLFSTVLFSIGVMALIFSVASGNLYGVSLALLFLILGLIGSGFNPNLASLIMMALGSLLLTLELLVIPGFGVAGITGIAFLLFGILLLPTSIPVTTALTSEQLAMFRITAMVVGLVGITAVTFIFMKLVKIRKMKKQLFNLEGKVGRAVDRLVPNSFGYVVVEGEYWLAKSEETVEPGDLVYVVKYMENYLLVRRHGP